MTVSKITPILFAEEIEPCLKFWVERLGFEKTIDVPDGNKLAFAILAKNGVELMYQTFASAEKDVPRFRRRSARDHRSYMSRWRISTRSSAELNGAEVMMPVRTTFYGAKEIGIKDPAGHILIFAQMAVATQP